jgi:hypothetical protein
VIGKDVGMENESPSIDPRYRPEFQRGYTGAEVPVPVPLAPVNSASEPIQVGPPSAARNDVESPTESGPPVIESEPAPRRRNPYFLVIPLAGAVAILLGAWLTVSQWITNYSNQSESSTASQRRFVGVIIYAFSSPLITVGLAVLFGFVFWLALRRRP